MTNTDQIGPLEVKASIESWRDDATITVLHVDDEPDFAELAATFLERLNEDIEVVTETSVEGGLDQLARSTPVDCIVSDYQMPGQNGIEFLEAVREEHPQLPFILFTGKGSEEVASDAVSAGVTDYMQKERGTDQFQILANRIEHVVDGYRFQHMCVRRGQRLDTLISNLPGIVYRSLDETRWPMEFVEGECEQITGYESSEIECGDVSFGDDIVHPDDQDSVREAVQDGIEKRQPFEITYRIRTADGDLKWVWERGRGLYSSDDELIALEGFITDTTGQVEQETGAIPDSGPLRTLFDNATDCIAYCEFQEDIPVIVRVNPAFEDTFGYDSGEFVETPLEEAIVSSESVDKVRKISQRVKRGEAVEAELKCRTPEGVRSFSHRAIPMITDGEVTTLYAVFTDLTERRRDKQQLQRLEYFAERLSHDLRNPLTVAQGNLQLLHETHDEQYFDTANRALARIDSLISDILTLAQTGEQISLSEYEAVELVTVAESAWVLLQNGGSTLTVEDSTTVEADPSRLRQILENLFRNALEHGPDNVSVRVGILSDEAGFYVADDGPGIPPGERASVFDPEYSTKDDGTGFGLATIDQIVDAHGWEVRLRESVEGGTRVELFGIDGLTH